MASFHFTAKMVSRSTGRSAVAAAAYRAGVNLVDDRTGLNFRFGRRGGVIGAFMIAPDGADWALDRAALWNAAESDPRKNAATAREFVAALPAELTLEQSKQLLQSFSRALSDRYCVAVDVAMHEADKGGDNRNRHAHILVPTKVTTATGLGKKTVVLDDRTTGKVEITALRHLWAKMTNDALAGAQCPARVTAKSYATQIDEIATDHAQMRETYGSHIEISTEKLDKATAGAATATKHIGYRATALERKAQREAADAGLVYTPTTDQGRANKERLDTRAELLDAQRKLKILESLLVAAKKQEDDARRTLQKAAEKKAAEEIEEEKGRKIKAAAAAAAAEIKDAVPPAPPPILTLAAPPASVKVEPQPQPQPQPQTPTRPKITAAAPAPIVTPAAPAAVKVKPQPQTPTRPKITAAPAPIMTPAAPPAAVKPEPEILRPTSPTPVFSQKDDKGPPQPKTEPFPFNVGGKPGVLLRFCAHLMLNGPKLPGYNIPNSPLQLLQGRAREALRTFDGNLIERLNNWLKSRTPDIADAAAKLLKTPPDMREVGTIIKEILPPRRPTPEPAKRPNTAKDRGKE